MIRNIFFAAGILLIAAACSKSDEGTTPSGFKYIHHIKNDGPKPQAGEYVYFHVEMTNGDSLLFSSHNEPEIPLVLMPTAEEMAGQRPSPVLEGLGLMSVGDSLTVFFPVDSLGDQRPAGFENAEFVVYNLYLKEIKSAAQYEEAAAAEQAAAEAALSGVREQTQSLLAEFKEGKLADRLQKTESGMQYILLEEGTGAPATQGQNVTGHYYGILMDGTEFDNSFSRGKPFSFDAGVGQVIPGWDEAFTTLKQGSKAVLFIPSNLAYGERANAVIPANSDLVFYIDFLSVK
ncbi:MAG: FKBP-type peptidyl-prolyl cis-trans isomerase [Saprospiraceae bacterium]